MKLKPEKNAGLDGIQTHDLCDTRAVLYQLSYQANLELTTFGVCDISEEDKEFNVKKDQFEVFE